MSSSLRFRNATSRPRDFYATKGTKETSSKAAFEILSMANPTRSIDYSSRHYDQLNNGNWIRRLGRTAEGKEGVGYRIRYDEITLRTHSCYRVKVETYVRIP